MRNTRFFSLAIFASIFIISSCTKEGPEGPAGPPGPQGPQGNTGATGPAGTANVIYSDWFTAEQNGGWVDTTINAQPSKKFNRAAPGITLNVLNQGIVLAYMKLFPDGAGDTTISIRQLPYPNPGASDEFIIIPMVGSITYALVPTTAGGITTELGAGLEFRYVVVPGGVAGGRVSSGSTLTYSVEQLKRMSYEEIKNLFNIPD
ncbi:MAG: hypothetical protein ICV66_03155 [Chitinophagaceae bacterium]|nr:hypothetical protein [Chitinophagaceae bacterium]